MVCYSALVEGQNGTPLLGLCHFISEKNVVQAPRVFKVNSYIELSRSGEHYKIGCGIQNSCSVSLLLLVVPCVGEHLLLLPLYSLCLLKLIEVHKKQ